MQMIRTSQTTWVSTFNLKPSDKAPSEVEEEGVHKKKWIDNIKEWKSTIILFFP